MERFTAPPAAAPPVPVLRPARLGDVPDLHLLETRTFATDRLSARSWRHLLASPSADTAVLVCRGQLAGAGVLLRRRGTRVGRIYSLAVDPSLRGHGLSTLLLDHLLRLARRRGVQRVRLEVRPENSAALCLYLGHGFRPIGVSLGYYQDGTPCVHLEISLSAAAATPRAA